MYLLEFVKGIFKIEKAALKKASRRDRIIKSLTICIRGFYGYKG